MSSLAANEYVPVSCSLFVEVLRLNSMTKRGEFIHAVVEGTDLGKISNEGATWKDWYYDAVELS